MENAAYFKNPSSNISLADLIRVNTFTRVKALLLRLNILKKRNLPPSFSLVKKGNKFLATRSGLKFLVDHEYEADVLNQIFDNGEYKSLDLKGKVVLDIGANIGDTAIYFSKISKAKKVISLEPYPNLYKIAKNNLKINNIKNVNLLNKAAGGKSTRIKIDPGFTGSGSTDLKSFKTGVSVEVLTLKDLVDRYKLNGAVAKIDCEGSEYSLILNSDKETLGRFEQMVIECHYGYKNIAAKLVESGFKVSHTRTGKCYNPSANYPKMFINLVFAIKQ